MVGPVPYDTLIWQVTFRRAYPGHHSRDFLDASPCLTAFGRQGDATPRRAPFLHLLGLFTAGLQRR